MATPYQSLTDRIFKKDRFSDAIQSAKDIITPAARVAFNTFSPVPLNLIPDQVKQGVKTQAQNLPGYVKGRVIDPAVQGARQIQKPGLVNKGLGTLQIAGAAYNATPFGIGENALESGIASAIESKRTGQPFSGLYAKNVKSPMTGIASTGFGVQGPVGSIADIALNPSIMASSLKKIPGVSEAGEAIISRMNRGGVRRIPDVRIQDQDVDEILNIADFLRKKRPGIDELESIYGDVEYVWNKVKNQLPEPPSPRMTTPQKLEFLEKWAKQNESYRSPKKYVSMGITDKNAPSTLGDISKLQKSGLVSGFAGGNSRMEKTIEKAKNVEQAFRADKFNLNKSQTKTLDNLRKALGLEKRTVRTFEDMKALAEELGTNPQKLIKDITNKRITDSEVVALGNTISTSSQRVEKLIKKLSKDPTNQGILSQIDAEERLLNAAIRKRIKGGTEAGRAVVAFRILANKTLDPTYWLSKASKQLGETRSLKAEEIDAINKLINDKDRLGLARFVSMLGESSFREKAIGLWKAGLLTSFRTHEGNLISNAAFGALETAKDLPATVFDAARSAITGGPRTKSFGTKTITSQGGGVVEGAKQASKYLKDGIDVRDVEKVDTYKPLRFGESRLGRLAQKYTDTVFGTLGAEDKIFREAAVSRSLAEQAAVEGINKKLTAGQIQKLIDNPTKEMIEAAVKDAEYATFNNPNKVSDAIRAAKSAAGEGGRAILDFTLPFVRTPTNVAKAAIDYTPIGIVRDTVSKLINGKSVSDKQLANSFGRSITGTGLIWAGYKLAEAGKIQGASPSSEAERSQMYLEGRQPNSIKVGDTWRSINRISPVGNLLVLGAEYFKSGKDLLETGASGVKSLSEQTFLKGLSGTLAAVNDPQRGAKKYLESAISGVVPNIIKDVAKGGDPYLRENNSNLDVIKSGIPGIKETLPARLDAMGDAIKSPGGYGTALFDPTNPKKATNDPIIKEMGRVGYNLNTVGDTLGGQKLTPDQKREYQRIAGEQIRNVVPLIISSQAYQGADIDTQRSLIEKAVNKAKDIARETIKPRLNEIKNNSGIKVKASEENNNPLKISPESGGIYFYVDGDGTMQTINTSKILNMPSKTRYDKAEKNKAIFNSIPKILNLDPSQQVEVLNKFGVSIEDAHYYDVARKENAIKYQYILDQLDKNPYNLDTLISMRREVNGKMVLSSGVIDSLVDDGYITYDQGSQLKKYKLDDKGNLIQTGRLKTAKTKKLKAATPPSIKLPGGVNYLKARSSRGSNKSVKIELPELSAPPQFNLRAR